MPQPPYRWRRADESDLFLHCPDHETKSIYYAREYTSGGTYAYSETNSYIANLKKRPSSPIEQLRYKQQAIRRFAAEAAPFLEGILQSQKGFLVPIPASYRSGHPDHDNRLDAVAALIAVKCANITVAPLLERTADKIPGHQSGAKGAQVELESMALSAHTKQCKPKKDDILIVLDDVTTSGGTFEAARILLSGQFPTMTVIGAMWAKAKAKALPPS
jgi:hypothetical protein